MAIYTGLGFKLWTAEKDTDSGADDLSTHNIFAIKQRVEQLLTQKMQDGYTVESICKELGLNRRQFDSILKMFDQVNTFEQMLKKL